MTDKSDHDTRWRLVRDVAVFQIKLGMEAVLDLTLIPASLAAAALDLLWELATATMVLRRASVRRALRTPDQLMGRREPGVDAPQSEVDAVMRSIETLIRNPGTGPDKVRELRRWAATKLAPSGDGDLQPPDDRRNDLPS